MMCYSTFNRQRTIWIDLICIDQSNDTERGHQVALMGQIYRKAQRTIAWLGHDDGTVRHAVTVLQDIVSEMDLETDDCDYDNMWVMRVGKCGAGTSIPRAWPYPGRIKSFVNLLQRPWFTRLWCIQEAVLPPETICVIDAHQFNWVDVSKAATWLLYKSGRSHPHDIPQTYRRNLDITSQLWKKFDYRRGIPLNVDRTTARATHPEFCNSLQNVGGFEVTDPRDRVYGILGMMEWKDGLP
jgi:hypothetical protein